MVEYILTVLIIGVIIYALLKGCSVNININVKQEFSQEDRQLLEDLYNKDGDPKDNTQDQLEAVVKSINSIMLDSEEELDG